MMTKLALRTFTVALAVLLLVGTSQANWVSQDIGNPLPGSMVIDGPDAITLTANGNDIWNTSDNFRFAYDDAIGAGGVVTGNFDAIVHVGTIPDGGNVWQKAGLMARETLAANSRFVMGLASNNNSDPAILQWRDTTGGGAARVGNIGAPSPADGDIWLRLTRNGNWFRAMWAPDAGGAPGAWSTHPTNGFHSNPAMPADVYLGIALTSHEANALTTVSFSGIDLEYQGPGGGGAAVGAFNYVTNSNGDEYDLYVGTTNEVNGDGSAPDGGFTNGSGIMSGSVIVPAGDPAAGTGLRMLQASVRLNNIGDPIFGGTFTTAPGSSFLIYEWRPGAVGGATEPGNTNPNISGPPSPALDWNDARNNWGAYVPRDDMGPVTEFLTSGWPTYPVTGPWRAAHGVSDFSQTVQPPTFSTFENTFSFVPDEVGDAGTGHTGPVAPQMLSTTIVVPELTNAAVFSSAFIMLAEPVFVGPDPVPDPQQPPGLYTQIAASSTPLTSLADAATALARVRNDPDHKYSDLTDPATTFMNIGGGGAGGSLGVFPYVPDDDSDTGGTIWKRYDYALRSQGYLYIDPAWDDDGDPGNGFLHVRTFGGASVDGYRMTIGTGGSEQLVLEVDGARNFPAAYEKTTLNFEQPGWYPFEIEYFTNRTNPGNQPGGLEVLSHAGLILDDSEFWPNDFLGHPDSDLVIQQRPDGMPTEAQVGANDVAGGPELPLAAVGGNPGSGLHVQVSAPGATNIVQPGSLSQADAAIANGPLVYDSSPAGNPGDVPLDTFNWTDPANGGSGHFGGNTPFPGLNNGVDNNDFAWRLAGLIRIDAPGTYSFGFTSDDLAEVRVQGQALPGPRQDYHADMGVAYANFTQAGLYRIEVVGAEDGGGAFFEFAHSPALDGGKPDLLVSNQNLNTQGGQLDFQGTLYPVNPVAHLSRGIPFDLNASAYAVLPDAPGSILPPDSWKLEQLMADVPGLQGFYYTTSGGLTLQGWRHDLVAPANSLTPGDPSTAQTEFNFQNNYAYSTQWGNLEDNFFVDWRGVLTIPTDGTYRFAEHVDDQSRLYLDDLTTSILGNNTWNDWTETTQVLTAGEHLFRYTAQEGGGGEFADLLWFPEALGASDDTGGPSNWANNDWEFMPASLFSFDYWIELASGTNQLGDLFGDEFLLTMPFSQTPVELRLTAEWFGIEAMYQQRFLFVPEPGSLALLGLGLAALARRRRRK